MHICKHQLPWWRQDNLKHWANIALSRVTCYIWIQIQHRLKVNLIRLKRQCGSLLFCICNNIFLSYRCQHLRHLAPWKPFSTFKCSNCSQAQNHGTESFGLKYYIGVIHLCILCFIGMYMSSEEQRISSAFTLRQLKRTDVFSDPQTVTFFFTPAVIPWGLEPVVLSCHLGQNYGIITKCRYI